jgi:tRNA(fMet)-specific endonuclease VapC
MTYIWDTNIFIHSLRKPAFLSTLNNQYDCFGSSNELLVSTVTIGELRSFTLRNRWGRRLKANLADLLKHATPIPITDEEDLIQTYADIDVYSQSHHPTLRLPTSARKMSKNDLWIAATTAIFGGVLLSTDNDFEHLDGVFFPFEKIVV